MYSVALITVPNKKEALSLTRALLKEKLAACVNIIEKVDSWFWWQGRIDHSSEYLLIIKTRKALSARLIRRIRALHSYTVPEIIFLPITAGNKKYLEWINDSTCR